MSIITPGWFQNFETKMEVISTNAYSSLSSSGRLWYPKAMKNFDMGTSRTKVLTWLLETARIRRTKSSRIRFEDLMTHQTTITVSYAGDGFRINRDDLEDQDGNGMQLSGEWARQVGAWSAYWPQEELINAIHSNSGNGPTAYDGVSYFATNHHLNPYVGAAGGTYANLHTGLPIDESVDVDVALANLNTVLSNIAEIKMPNGKVSRGLVATTLIVPKRLGPRAAQLTNAKVIAQVAGSGAGSGDVEAVIRRMGMADVVEVPELGAAFGGSNTTYYVLTSTAAESELGAWVYAQRSPFKINFYGPQTDAQLSRMKKFEWEIEGRNEVEPGHPFGMHKVTA